MAASSSSRHCRPSAALVIGSELLAKFQTLDRLSQMLALGEISGDQYVAGVEAQRSWTALAQAGAAAKMSSEDIAAAMEQAGASAEIVETEVTRKVEEAINAIAGVNQLYSRSYSGTSVVIVQFNLDLDSRKAADARIEAFLKAQAAPNA